ncbi:MAG: putative nucleic acid-binding Zn ribbon protein [Arenicella sp.]|jgi:predicted nucleic acid-binding Zn ribbon protein
MKTSVQSFLQAMGIDAKMHEASVLAKWEEIMGSAVAKRTEKKYIRNRTLYLHMNSSVMRDELMQQRSKIVEKINQVSGIPIIDAVHLT